MIYRPSTALVLLGVLVTACTTTTIEPATPTSVAPPPVAQSSTTMPSASTTDPLAPAVELVDCDEAPDSVAIVCEAYELIQIHYVDQIEDSLLAEAAASGLDSLVGEPVGQIICAVPAIDFEEACDSASDFDGTSALAAEAMVAGLATFALDPNSTYFDEDALALLEQEQEGEIEGIGALVSPEDETLEGDNKQCSFVSDTCRILIVSTIEGAPAERAGLMRNDVIVEINGESINGWTVDEVTSQVRGPAGTTVRLTLNREGEIIDVSIVRAAVVIPVIESEVFGNNGYIRLRVFSQTADEQFENAMIDLLGQGVDSLVIDLRNNPGGLLDTAVAVVSLFLADGDIVVTQSRTENTSYPVNGDSIVPNDMTLVFVVNKGSASASEVVSAVLQERGLATVVGENTFGKNTVQQRFSLSNGGALQLTIARWLTPDGLDFGGVGVTPDVELDTEDLEAEALVTAVLDSA
jgi:carboxyl-terminal processing protease